MRFEIPSRTDAWDLTRKEKAGVTYLTSVTSCFLDTNEDLHDRIAAIDGGQEVMNLLMEKSSWLLTEIRKTIPEKQRASLVNTARDYEMRLIPKMTPSKTNVIVEKEDFRTLVDSAQEKCVSCAETAKSCRECGLFGLLLRILPLDEYDEDAMLCPYNMAKWGN